MVVVEEIGTDFELKIKTGVQGGTNTRQEILLRRRNQTQFSDRNVQIPHLDVTLELSVRKC